MTKDRFGEVAALVDMQFQAKSADVVRLHARQAALIAEKQSLLLELSLTSGAGSASIDRAGWIMRKRRDIDARLAETEEEIADALAVARAALSRVEAAKTVEVAA